MEIRRASRTTLLFLTSSKKVTEHDEGAFFQANMVSQKVKKERFISIATQLFHRHPLRLPIEFSTKGNKYG